jgi:hypothetical protein
MDPIIADIMVAEIDKSIDILTALRERIWVFLKVSMDKAKYPHQEICCETNKAIEAILDIKETVRDNTDMIPAPKPLPVKVIKKRKPKSPAVEPELQAAAAEVLGEGEATTAALE